MVKGLFIKNWTMPEGCYECYFEYDEFYCDIAEKKINCKGKPDWCPLKEINLKGEKYYEEKISSNI